MSVEYKGILVEHSRNSFRVFDMDECNRLLQFLHGKNSSMNVYDIYIDFKISENYVFTISYLHVNNDYFDYYKIYKSTLDNYICYKRNKSLKALI